LDNDDVGIVFALQPLSTATPAQYLQNSDPKALNQRSAGSPVKGLFYIPISSRQQLLRALSNANPAQNLRNSNAMAWSKNSDGAAIKLQPSQWVEAFNNTSPAQNRQNGGEMAWNEGSTGI